ncbi:hypothetical protein N9360_01080 [Candidatus Marinimicrobia bacterium]|nr:hypothetical protein [Candidatus Neomarinimicrobiota bacterium]MDB3887656.1 hypothetical protein [Candidatus Neomarinimicrobiota bacterium]
MLRKWLVFHFYVDYAVAIPIFLGAEQIAVYFPEYPLDTVALRIVAAALFGIGFSSLQASSLNYDNMVKKLRWAVIWSGTAWTGVLISLVNGGHPLNWPVFITFVLFNFLWTYYAVKLGSFNNFYGSVKKLLRFNFE